MDLSSNLPDEAITGRLREIGTHERRLLVETLRHLAELERRNAILAMGYPSSFAFCSEFLGYSNGSAFRRTKAARLLARFPVVADYLADGRLTLRKLVELREVLDEGNVVALLDRRTRSRCWLRSCARGPRRATVCGSGQLHEMMRVVPR